MWIRLQNQLLVRHLYLCAEPTLKKTHTKKWFPLTCPTQPVSNTNWVYCLLQEEKNTLKKNVSYVLEPGRWGQYLEIGIVVSGKFFCEGSGERSRIQVVSATQYNNPRLLGRSNKGRFSRWGMKRILGYILSPDVFHWKGFFRQSLQWAINLLPLFKIPGRIKSCSWRQRNSKVMSVKTGK